MKSLRTIIYVGLFVVALGITALSGFVHGRLTGRWGDSPVLTRAIERLPELPSTIGRWQLHKEAPLSEDVLEDIQCVSYVNRVYVHADTGRSVMLTIVLGPPDKIWAHSPQGCYPSTGLWVVHRERTKVAIDHDGKNELWDITFQSTDVNAELLRVYYAWSSGENWLASTDPRFIYGGREYLYRLQVATFGSRAAENRDPCGEFAKELLPVLAGHLVSAPDLKTRLRESLAGISNN